MRDHSVFVADDRDFLTRFERGEIPRAEWGHHAHLRIVWLYLLLHGPLAGPGEALDAVRAYNARCRKTCHHETMTRFWIAQAAREIAKGSGCADFAAFLAASPRLEDLLLCLEYYSRDRLFSPAARDGWVEPDLKPLDAD